MVDSPHDLKFETTAAAVGREFAILANSGAGQKAWWSFRKRVEGGKHAEIVDKLMASTELKDLTRQNIGKALAFRTSPLDSKIDIAAESDTDASIKTVVPEADDSPHVATPTSTFLNRAHEHYLRTLASFDSLHTSPVADPSRLVKQLTERLNPSEARGLPLPVVTVPRMGRVFRAGEVTDGWNARDGEAKRFSKGGPISRAKGSRSREGRSSVWTGTRRDSSGPTENL